MSVMIADAALYGRELVFRYGDECITIRRLDRSQGINRVLIKVHPDTRVEALAPREASDDEVLDAVRQRARWIYQQLRQFRAQNEYVIPRRYVSGESHYYLGRQHLLKVIETLTERQGVKLLRGRLEVRVRHKRPDKVRQLLARWYRERAGEVFGRRLDAMLEQALWVSERPPMRVQAMQTRWGSCSPQGRLTLNPHLVKAPRECVDYVILHELCHIAEHNHSERFYRLMGQVMPQWEGIKARLDDMAGRLID
ncbi:M48 family metallopeptidase [Halomonas salinarum]|uniref:M48 family metallopeptidase n=1 Tax=Halomonas salinarum TaxID=1158993 RepID=UPI00143B8386|nr:SprT family zinc-dependent metalloprotease [Halomonas salinarum]